jgi:CubicO group peptidase (beta-lactamase class C family)
VIGLMAPRATGDRPPSLTVIAAALVLSFAAPAQALVQGDLGAVVEQDLTSWSTGFVVAVQHQGQLQFLDAFGARAALPHVDLLPTDIFAFPALTEILVGMAVEALNAAGMVDAEAPLSTYLPLLDPGVGSATLAQLLTHTAGLDNASRLEGETWRQTLDRVDDLALVTAPGTIYSQSQHSLPMAARVLERVVGRPLDQIVTVAVLVPLGMRSSTFDLQVAGVGGLVQGVERSNDVESTARLVEFADTVLGLPVLFTTAEDVLTLLSAWMDGGIRGRPPTEIASASHPTSNTALRYGAGIWVDEWRGQTRVFRNSSGLGTSAGFSMFPQTRSIVFIWSLGEWPYRTEGFVMDRVGEAIGAVVEPGGPGRARMGSVEYSPPDPVRWAGTYRNGELIFVLRESEGALVFFDGSRELSLTPVSESAVVAYLPDGRPAVRLDLRTDAAGRRYLYYGSLAYRHQDDRIRN